MSNCTWSQHVACNFDSAADQYHSGALTQQRIARAFGQWIASQVGNATVENALEIGCGTGFLSSQILAQWPEAQWLITDTAPGMIRRCEHELSGYGFRTRFAVDDGESIDIPSGSLDLIVSNMTFQWFANSASSSRRLLEFLRPGGMLGFTTLGENTFRSARQLIEGVFYRYPTKSQLHIDLQSADSNCHVESHLFLDSAMNLRGLLRHLNSIGAGTPVPGNRVRTSLLRRAIRKSASQPTELAVEYEVLFVAIKKC